MATSVSDRFWSKVDKQSSGCWVWTASTAGQSRYGYFYIEGGRENRIRVYAHRWSYEESKGQVPVGLELDHLCRVRLCVNPDHLEPVTHAVNRFRARGFKVKPQDLGETCKYGHSRAEFTRLNSAGNRYCAACARDAQARWRSKNPKM